MPYDNNVPVDTNAVRGAAGDLALMQTNFAILASVVSGMTAPSESAPMRELVVTSGANNWGLGWNGNSGALVYNGTKVLAANATAFNFLVKPGSNAGAPSIDTHLVRRQDLASPFGMVEALGGHIVTVASGSVFVLDERAMYGYDIVELHAQTASGTADITVKVGAVTVSGLDGVTLSGTQISYNTSGAFTVVSGDRLTLTVDAHTGDPSDLSFTFKVVRT